MKEQLWINACKLQRSQATNTKLFEARRCFNSLFCFVFFVVVVALCSRGNRKTWKEVHNYCTLAEVWRETLKLTSDADARLKCTKQRMLVGNDRIHGACVNTRTVP